MGGQGQKREGVRGGGGNRRGKLYTFDWQVREGKGTRGAVKKDA